MASLRMPTLRWWCRDILQTSTAMVHPCGAGRCDRLAVCRGDEESRSALLLSALAG